MLMAVYECQFCGTPFAVKSTHTPDGIQVWCPICHSDDLEELGCEDVHVPQTVHD